MCRVGPCVGPWATLCCFFTSPWGEHREVGQKPSSHPRPRLAVGRGPKRRTDLCFFSIAPKAKPLGKGRGRRDLVLKTGVLWPPCGHPLLPPLSVDVRAHDMEALPLTAL